MRVRRIDHIGVIVDDLAAAKAFFLDFGLEALGDADMEGEVVDRLLGLRGVKTSLVMMRPPGGEACIELIKFHSPEDDNDVQLSVTAPGIRHIAFLVEDLDALVATLKAKGADVFSEIQTYENRYKLCYVRGPEGIILDLAEEIT